LNKCTDDEDTVKTNNKKGSSFPVHKVEGQYSDIKAEEDNNYEDSSDEESGVISFLQYEVVCSIQDEAAIPKGWIMLDSHSTVDMFSNPKLLHNIRDAKRNLFPYCNAGKAIISILPKLKMQMIYYHCTMQWNRSTPNK